MTIQKPARWSGRRDRRPFILFVFHPVQDGYVEAVGSETLQFAALLARAASGVDPVDLRGGGSERRQDRYEVGVGADDPGRLAPGGRAARQLLGAAPLGRAAAGNGGEGGPHEVGIPPTGIGVALHTAGLVERLHLADPLVAGVPHLHPHLARLDDVVHDVQLQVVDAASGFRRRRTSDGFAPVREDPSGEDAAGERGDGFPAVPTEERGWHLRYRHHGVPSSPGRRSWSCGERGEELGLAGARS